MLPRSRADGAVPGNAGNLKFDNYNGYTSTRAEDALGPAGSAPGRHRGPTGCRGEVLNQVAKRSFRV